MRPFTLGKAALGRHQQEAGVGLGRDDPVAPRLAPFAPARSVMTAQQHAPAATPPANHVKMRVVMGGLSVEGVKATAPLSKIPPEITAPAPRPAAGICRAGAAPLRLQRAASYQRADIGRPRHVNDTNKAALCAVRRRRRAARRCIQSGGTASVHLTLAVCDYEHVRELTTGVVRADGITLTPLVLAVDRGDHLPFPQEHGPGMGRLRAFVREVHLAHVAGKCADDRDPGVSLARAPAFRDLRARRPRHQDREGPRRPHARHSGMGADRRHLCARLSRRGLRRRPRLDPLAAGRRQRARPRREGRAEAPRRHPLRGARPDTSLSAMLRERRGRRA